jgi:predicted lipid-binding transport protein (Tim44 family)
MTDGYQMVEIVFLAMLAGFIALRLYSVLGRRTGHQGEPPVDVFSNREKPEIKTGPVGTTDSPAARDIRLPAGLPNSVEVQLRGLAAADPSFDPTDFLSGARSAYPMILEAFWRGDEAELKPLVSDEIFDQFSKAIAQRKAEAVSLDHELIEMVGVQYTEAQLEGAMAEITVRFDSKMKTVTRDASGALISGNPDQVIESHDLWTFSRHLRSSDPNWLLIATDADG